MGSTGGFVNSNWLICNDRGWRENSTVEYYRWRKYKVTTLFPHSVVRLKRIDSKVNVVNVIVVAFNSLENNTILFSRDKHPRHETSCEMDDAIEPIS